MDSIDARNILTEYNDPAFPDSTGSIDLNDNQIFDAGTLFVDFNEVYFP